MVARCPMHTCASNTLAFVLHVPASDHGLFLSDEDPRKGIWLESGRTLDYYMLRNGVGVSQPHTNLFSTGVFECQNERKRVFFSLNVALKKRCRFSVRLFTHF